MDILYSVENLARSDQVYRSVDNIVSEVGGVLKGIDGKAALSSTKVMVWDLLLAL